MRQNIDVQRQQAWNGHEGAHWARNPDRWDAVNEGFDAPLLDAAAIKPADAVLDIGCGTGATTRLAARRAADGRATGVDLSGLMLERARATSHAERLGNLTFERGDAQVHPLAGRDFDVAISRYGVMFFTDPVAAFTNIGCGLRRGGRMAFICAAGDEGNEWLQALTGLRDCLPLSDFGVARRTAGHVLARRPRHGERGTRSRRIHSHRSAAHGGTRQVGTRSRRRCGLPARLRSRPPYAAAGGRADRRAGAASTHRNAAHARRPAWHGPDAQLGLVGHSRTAVKEAGEGSRRRATPRGGVRCPAGRCRPAQESCGRWTG
jgi:SAM-dependent methyltransferase